MGLIFQKIKSSLKLKLLFTFYLVILITFIIIAILSTNIFTSYFLDTHETQAFQTLEQVRKNIQFHVGQLKSVSDSIYVYLGKNIRFPEYGDIREMVSDYENYSSIVKTLTGYYESNPYIGSISIITKNNTNIYVGETSRFDYEYLAKQKWFQNYEIFSGKAIWIFFGINNETDELNLCYVRGIISPYNNKNIGYLIISIDPAFFDFVFTDDNYTQLTDFYIINSQNIIIYSNNSSEISNDTSIFMHTKELSSIKKEYSIGFINQDKKIISSISMSAVDWQIFSLTSMKLLYQEVLYVRNIFYISIFVSLLFLFSLVFIFSKKYLEPIAELSFFIKKITSEENFNQRVVLKGSDEISYLGRYFNVMLDKIEDLIEKIYLDMEKQRVLEIKALQSQINPHFLYNTLSSINCIAKINSQEEISQMVISLSNLLRLSIDTTDNFISIEDETDYLNDYINIQKIRYKGKIKFNCKMNGSLLSNKIPKLILQPLVENSIHHSLKRKTNIVEININIEKKEENKIEYIFITITDNGPGIDPDKITKFNNPLELVDENVHVGIKNILKRLDLYYKGAVKVRFFSNEKGTIISIMLPINE